MANKDRIEYKKSVSNYVIKELHQTTDKGDIFERDITTIGGRNYFEGGTQRPVYQTGNFVITTSDEVLDVKPTSNWFDDYDEEEYTWGDVESVNETEDPSIAIEVKPDVYDLRNFAYYGSCAELIRGSLNHIVSEFPGEVYATQNQVTYLVKEDGNEEYKILGNDDGEVWSLIDNPFALSLHEEYVDQVLIDESPLKYLYHLSDKCTIGEDVKRIGECEYEFIDVNNNANDEFSLSFSPNCEPVDMEDCCVIPYDYIGLLTLSFEKGIDVKRLNSVTQSYTYTNFNGEQETRTRTILEVSQANSQRQILIKVYKGEGDSFIYLSNYIGWHLRPRSHYYDAFKTRLSLFEKTLLNENTTPKYAPKFDIYKENDWGYEKKLETFAFPIGEGGYNLGLSQPAYLMYVDRLTKIAIFYDEHFSDNLYRVMTHESIKNFDWSFKRQYSEGEEDAYLEGGGRIQKFIRLMGREFDEIKLYIDNIGNASRITYDGIDNSPDYFLTDQIELEGWDYKHIIPSDDIDKFHPYEESVMPYKKNTDEDSAEDDGIVYFNNNEYTASDINNLFTRILKLNSRAIWRKKGTISCIESLLSLFGLKSKRWADMLNAVKSNKIQINNCLDTESSASTDTSVKKVGFDYSIEEFVSVVDDAFNASENDSQLVDEEGNVSLTLEQLLKINEMKLISFEEDKYLNVQPTPWRGLTVKQKGNKLYPYFNKDAKYDGNPYYQMNGGWLYKEKVLGEDYSIADTNTSTETLNRTKGVKNLASLLKLPATTLKDGDFCYVENLDIDYVILDGIAYELKDYCDTEEFRKHFSAKEWIEKSEEIKNKFQRKWFYFDRQVINSSVILGNAVYENTLHCQKPIYETQNGNEIGNLKSSITIAALNDYANYSMVRFYVENKINGFTISDIKGHTPNHVLLITQEVQQGVTINNLPSVCAECDAVQADGDSSSGDNNVEENKASHYFMLNKSNFSYLITMFQPNSKIMQFGWNQLGTNSDEYKRLMMIKDYYLGNNPHTASKTSDLGYEYMDYFIHLFKYSIEHDLLDWDKIYDYLGVQQKDRLKIKQYLSKEFGFKGIAATGCSSYNVTECSKVCTTIVDKDDEDTYYVSYGDLSTEEGDVNGVSALNFEIREDVDLEGVDSDLIINTKGVVLTFYYDNNLKDAQIKYIDKIVIPYLTQVLPSSIIIKIAYQEQLTNA